MTKEQTTETTKTTETHEPPESKFTQADVDRIIAERLKREGISDLRAKAQRLDELEQQTKTTEQQTAERLAKMEAAIESSTVEALRMRIANRFGVTEDDAELFLTATDAEGLEKQAKRLAERNGDVEAKAKRGRNHVPAEGTNNGTPAENADRKFVREVFAGGN